MRWILVLLIVYIIPLTVLFKNYNENIRKRFLYASSYIVVMSTIVITNIYISGLNEIEEKIYYRASVYEEKDDKESDQITSSRIEKDNNIKEKAEIETETIEPKTIEVYNEIEEQPEIIEQINDELVLKTFREDVYLIEERALIPMRECITYTDGIAKSLSKLKSIDREMDDAYAMCIDVINTYKQMEIPEMSKDRYTKVLYEARNDVKIAYELRAKAMDSGVELVDTKNPIHIVRAKEYLDLSDNYISSFKERLNNLEMDIENK